MINDTPDRNNHVGNGTVKSFAYQFEIADASHLEVLVSGSALTHLVDYTVTGVGNDAGGTVETTVAPANLANVSILRKQPVGQNTTYTLNEATPSARIEKSLDLIYMVLQMFREILGRSIKFSKKSLKKDIDIEDPEDQKFLFYDLASNKIKWGVPVAGAVVLPLSLANGGTGATTAAGARTALGLENTLAGRALLGAAPADATFILLNDHAEFPNHRRLVGGAGVTLTDNGPDNTLSIGIIAAQTTPPGTVEAYFGHTLQAGYLWCDGAAVSRATYAALFSAITKSATVTITIASPGVVTWNAHGLKNDDPISITTTGALPTGLTAGTTYYVRNKATNTFELSATQGGASINTSGTQSGTHTALYAPAGRGDGSTTFNVPDARGRAVFGVDDMGGSAANRVTTTSGIRGTILGQTGGDERMHQHNHNCAGKRAGDSSGGLFNLGGNTDDQNRSTDNFGAGGSQNMPPTLVCNVVIKT